MSYSITLIGCGKMGEAMLRSWLNLNLVSHITVIDPTPIPEDLICLSEVSYLDKYDNTAISTDFLILAVKPQVLKNACSSLAQNISKECTIISIAAGQTIENLESVFSPSSPIIRVMPNTPASIGKGVSVATSNASVQEGIKSSVSALLESCGQCHWLNDEHLMDSVTALSGSGPAYIFYLIEALAQSGEKLGLPQDMSMDLARQTVIGSAALAEFCSDTSAEQLRKNVTSPGGTTQAALEKMMDGRLQSLLDEALTAAKHRAEELSQ